MSRAAVAIILSEAKRREHEGLARRRKTAQGLARRARTLTKYPLHGRPTCQRPHQQNRRPTPEGYTASWPGTRSCPLPILRSDKARTHSGDRK